MTDLETRIKQLLNENVDELAGPRRVAPAFDPDAVETLPERRPRWTPLLAAASIVLLVAATVVAVTLLTRGSSTPPADRSPAPSSTAPSGPTVQKVVRPVTAAGRPAPGWTVDRSLERSTVSCPVTSQSSVDRGVAGCGFMGATGAVCWRSAEPKRVLCVFDVVRQKLVLFKLRGSFPSTRAVAQPVPVSLRLTDDTQCGRPTDYEYIHLVKRPQLVERYDCGPIGNIWGPESTDGLDRTNPVWTVDVFKTARSTGVTRDVRVVYVVGTRR